MVCTLYFSQCKQPRSETYVAKPVACTPLIYFYISAFYTELHPRLHLYTCSLACVERRIRNKNYNLYFDYGQNRDLLQTGFKTVSHLFF